MRVRLSRCCRLPIRIVAHKDNGKRYSTYECLGCAAKYRQIQFIESKTDWQIQPLAKNDFEFANKVLHVRNAKGGKDRNIPIMPQIKPKLVDILPISLTDRALNLALQKHAKDAGIEKQVHFHTLRHSGATRLLTELKWDIRYVQAFLGHSSITTTERYTHVTPQHLIEKAWEGY